MDKRSNTWGICLFRAWHVRIPATEGETCTRCIGCRTNKAKPHGRDMGYGMQDVPAEEKRPRQCFHRDTDAFQTLERAHDDAKKHLEGN